MVKVSTLNKSLHAVHLWLFSNLKNFHSEVSEESEEEAADSDVGLESDSLDEDSTDEEIEEDDA